MRGEGGGKGKGRGGRGKGGGAMGGGLPPPLSEILNTPLTRPTVPHCDKRAKRLYSYSVYIDFAVLLGRIRTHYSAYYSHRIQYEITNRIFGAGLVRPILPMISAQ